METVDSVNIVPGSVTIVVTGGSMLLFPSVGNSGGSSQEKKIIARIYKNGLRNNFGNYDKFKLKGDTGFYLAMGINAKCNRCMRRITS